MKMKKIISVLLTIMMVAGMFSSVVFATGGFNIEVPDTDNKVLGNELLPAIKAILGVITVIAGAAAVGMLIFIGIKYMTKGAGAKAEVKDTLLPYLIGAVIIASASKIAEVALNLKA